MKPIMSDQRKHQRFNVTEETRALIDNKIAKVVDISSGGLSLMFLDETATTMTGELFFDLLCHEKGLDTRQIPGKLIWEKEISFSAIPGMIYKKVGIQFGDLSSTQQTRLKTLLFNYNSVQLNAWLD